MDNAQINPVTIASYVSAAALASSKLISVCKPLWNRLPKWLAVVLPVLVLDLPQIAQFFAGATSGNELFSACITSLALLMPGLSEASPKREAGSDEAKSVESTTGEDKSG